MAIFELTNLKCYMAGSPNNIGWGDERPVVGIETGQGSVGQISMSVTRIDFTTPEFVNEDISLTIQVNGLAHSLYNYAKYSSMTLSNIAFETTASLVPNPLTYRNNNISDTLKESRIGTTVQGNLVGDTASFVLENVCLKPDTTYYLYFLRRNAPMVYTSEGASGYTGLFMASNVSVSLKIEIPQLSAPTITTTKQVLPCDGSVNVNWKAVSSKINNALNGYRVFLKVGSKPTEADNKIGDTTLTTYSFSLKDIKRGNKVYIGIQAISIYEGYKKDYPQIFENCNSTITTLELGSINSKPTLPTLTKSGNVVASGQPLTFSNITSTDVDNQTITYYYTLEGFETEKRISGNSLTLTLDSLTNAGITSSGEYSIKFYAYDSMDYGPEKTITFYAEFKPVVVTRSITTTSVEGGKTASGDTTNCLDTITINYTLQYASSNLTPWVYVYVGDNYQTQKELNLALCGTIEENKITIKVANIPAGQIAHGEEFKISFKIENSSGSSSEIGEKFGPYTRPQKMAASSITSCYTITNDATTHGTTWDNYFKKELNLNLKMLPTAVNQPLVNKVTLITRDKNGTLRTATLTQGTDNTLTMNNAIPKAGDWASIAIRVTDRAGQITETEELGTYYRVDVPVFPSNGDYNISITSILPCKDNGSFRITHPIASNKSMNNIPIAYTYSYSINGKSIQFQVRKDLAGSTNDTIKVIVDGDNITNLKKDILLEAVDATTNFKGSGIITITATDDFKQTIAYSGLSLVTNTRTAPSFKDATTFILRHNYDIGTNSSTQNNKAVPINSKYEYSEIFNSGEKIVFQIPKPVDPNDDITGINIYLYREKLPEDRTRIKKYDDILDSFGAVWLSIPISSLTTIENDNNNYYYSYTASPYSENEYFYFKIVAVDSLGQTSEALTNTQYIIGARTVPSQIEVTSKNTTIKRDESGEKASVTLNFDVNVLDLGGSASRNDNNKVTWDQSYYNEYPNFDRTFYRWYNDKYSTVIIKTYKKIKVEISPVADFSSGVLSTEDRRENPNGEWTFTIDGFDPNASRVYVRVTLYIPYALKNAASSINRVYITGTPTIFSYFETVPTVAYRPHQLGINTKNVDDESVLEIASYSNNGKNYNKIIIRRDIETSIVIDLDNQSITGLTIEGGSW